MTFYERLDGAFKIRILDFKTESEIFVFRQKGLIP